MKRDNKHLSAVEAKANCIKYMVQDILDNVSVQLEQVLSNFENDVLNVLKDDTRNWVPAKRKVKKIVDNPKI